MKKIYQILLLICLCVCFTGCGKTENTQREKRTTDTVADQGTETSKESNQNSESETENIGTKDDTGGDTFSIYAGFRKKYGMVLKIKRSRIKNGVAMPEKEKRISTNFIR